MKVKHKTYVDNSRFLQFISEMATQITEMNFGQETYEERKIYEGSYETHFTNEAQDYYNEMYDEYEMMANNIMGVYSDNELIKTK
jgi:hypothetical protein